MMSPELSRRAEALSAERTPFVVASVVRAQHPTSVSAGDTALVLGDGTIEGFVGGACAEQSVRLHALRALETAEPLLLRILPGDDDAPSSEGAVTVQNPCLSGGAIEIFLEPRLPAPRVLVVGATPIAGALARLGAIVNLDVVAVDPGSAPQPADTDLAFVVASHGHDELPALRSALGAGVPYVGLVASVTRGAAIVTELRETGTPEPQLQRLDTPAGIEIAARTPEEIALSILARIVAIRRGALEIQELGLGDIAERQPPEAAGALDPVCGMAVAAVQTTLHVEHEGRTVYFCSEGCRAAFEQDPARYAVAR